MEVLSWPYYRGWHNSTAEMYIHVQCTCTMYNVHVHTLSSERVNQLPPSLSRSSCPRHDDPLHRPAGFNDPWADAELEMGERDGRQEQTSLRRWARCSLPTGRLQGGWGNIVTLFWWLVCNFCLESTISMIQTFLSSWKLNPITQHLKTSIGPKLSCMTTLSTISTFFVILLLLSPLTDLEASYQLQPDSYTCPQADCHAHPNGHERVPVPDGRWQGQDSWRPPASGSGQTRVAVHENGGCSVLCKGEHLLFFLLFFFKEKLKFVYGHLLFLS